MRPFVEDLAKVATTWVACYPNAWLPNEFGLHDEQPHDTSRFLGEFARDGLVNIVGGCCGTTPEHVRQIAAAVDGVAPRTIPEPRAATRFSGLEPLELRPAEAGSVAGKAGDVRPEDRGASAPLGTSR